MPLEIHLKLYRDETMTKFSFHCTLAGIDFVEKFKNDSTICINNLVHSLWCRWKVYWWEINVNRKLLAKMFTRRMIAFSASNLSCYVTWTKSVIAIYNFRGIINDISLNPIFIVLRSGICIGESFVLFIRFSRDWRVDEHWFEY